MLNCLNGSFKSNADKSPYISAKIESGSKIDILLDMTEGSIMYVLNGKEQGFAVKDEDITK